ncbi:MAG: tRNA (adenosine(37)-N6)-dimethylallyltransferase MiaA [Myxococcota bacterium]
MSQMPLIVIAGPTATGKTSCAVELALRLNGELIGADSVQVYRGFDIGSAKPTEEELRGVPHHMIDIRDPDQPLDAGEYADLARAVIRDVQSRSRLPIVVGGTGLWLRALTRGLVALPRPDPELRAWLEAQADQLGLAALYERLQQVDPATAENLHSNDRVRIVRALEVYEQTGTPLGVHHARHALGAPRYEHLFIVVDLPREVHLDIIRARTRSMLEAGWVDEVRRLRARWGEEARPFGSVGYRQILEHLREEEPLAETERRIVRATRLYARRQRTWFASEPGVGWRTDPQTLLSSEGVRRIEGYLLRFAPE